MESNNISTGSYQRDAWDRIHARQWKSRAKTAFMITRWMVECDPVMGVNDEPKGFTPKKKHEQI